MGFKKGFVKGWKELNLKLSAEDWGEIAGTIARACIYLLALMGFVAVLMMLVKGII